VLLNVEEVAGIAYQFDRDETAWMTALASALRPALGPSERVTVQGFRARRAPAGKRSFLAAGDPRFETAVRALVGSAVDGSPAPCGSPAARPDGSVIVGLLADDAMGFGVLFAAPLPEPRRISPREAAAWRRAAAHVAAALQLRRILRPDGDSRSGTAPGPVDGPSALELPDETRRRLRAAAIRIDRVGPAPGGGPDDGPPRAWAEPSASRWSLVDRFDCDGHRYLVARRHRGERTGVAGLSLRECRILAYAASGHTNKWIGYALGLSPATVSAELGAAMRKMGIGSLAALVRGPASLPGAGEDVPGVS
jgi:DNA-binding CsgD family transcriptional regulator